MAHSVAKWSHAPLLKDLHPPRSTILRVSAPRLEQVEPSPPDDVPVTRARYTAGAFAPPAQRVSPTDMSRTTGPSRSGIQHSPQLDAADELFQRTAPMTEKQLEEFSTAVLGSNSSIWSAEERNRPASTSDSASFPEELGPGEQRSVVKWASLIGGLCFRGDLDGALRLIEECDKSMLPSVSRRFRHKLFLRKAAEGLKAKAAVQLAKLIALHQLKPELLVTEALQVCATCRDLEAGLGLVDWARKNGVRVDTNMMTTLIKVCKSVGNVERAFKLYQEMRAENMRIDAHVFGVLIATHAEAMKRDLTVVHERKDQFVLLERAFQLVEDAERVHIKLPEPAWNALIMCAGRSGEINRAFHVLAMMQRHSAEANAVTYGSLIESCVCAGNTEQALRVFEVALQKGFVSEVKLYTAALSACMRPMPHAWERAMQIYAAMQRASVRPDKKFFACLIAVAGRCGRLDTAFELLSEMAAEGIPPSSTSMSALVHACLVRGNLTLARRVYDLCAKQGVYPVLSQYNHLMDVYASEFRFGEVVSLLGDMVGPAGRQPNLNTYRILIDACSFTDQGGLAFQVFALMHANKVKILQEKFAQTIYYMLVKACFNQIRFLWSPAGYPPAGPLDAPAPPHMVAPEAAADSSSRQADSAGASTSGSNGVNGAGAHSQQQQQAAAAIRSAFAQQQQQLHPQPAGMHPSPVHHASGPPPERKLEAEKVLAALGAHKLRRGPHQSDPFEGPPDTIDWASHAISAFHHMLNRGFRPTLELLDLLFNCMRAKMLPEADLDSPAVPGGLAGRGPPGAGQIRAPFVPRRSRTEVFEVAFESRAFALVDEAIGRGLLPRYDLDAPLVVDMRRMPPVVCEVYVLHMLATLERRDREKKAKAAAAAAAAGTSGSSAAAAAAAAAAAQSSYHHPITLLVPPFDPDLVKWPSYLERMMNRYTETLMPEDQELVHRRYRRRSRAARRRSRSLSPRSFRRGPPLNGRNGADAAPIPRDGAVNAAANGAHDADGEAEVADVAALTDDRFINGALEDPWEEAEGVYNWADYDEEEDAGRDPSGGRYVADSTTGLAAAATLQRMKVWMDMDYVNGAITISHLEVMRFLKRRRQFAAAAAALVAEERAAAAAASSSASAAAGGAAAEAGARVGPGAAPVGFLAGGLAAGAMAGSRMMGIGGRPVGSPVEQQQRNIRLGMSSHAGPSGAAPPFQHTAPHTAAARAGAGIGYAGPSGPGSASTGSSNSTGGAAPGGIDTAAAAGPRSRPAPLPLTTRGSASAKTAAAEPQAASRPASRRDAESHSRATSPFGETRRRGGARDASAGHAAGPSTAGPNSHPISLEPETPARHPSDASVTEAGSSNGNGAHGHRTAGTSSPASRRYAPELLPPPQKPQPGKAPGADAAQSAPSLGVSSAEVVVGPGHQVKLSMPPSVAQSEAAAVGAGAAATATAAAASAPSA